MMRSPRRRRRPLQLRQGAFLLPSALTVGNMLLGFFAVVRGMRGDFELAALLIFCAAVLDTLDGRLARLTNTTSDFGAELDSLADVITFGMTPALLAWRWGLEQFGRAGWLIPLFYLVCAATRLARFNVRNSQHLDDPRFFVGLPTPAAAGAICSILYCIPNPGMDDLDPALARGLGLLLMGALLAVGTLMVSTFRFYSLKSLDLRKARSYRAMLPLAAVVLVAAWRPTMFFLAAASLYTLSGPVSWVVGRLLRSRSSEEGPEDESSPDSDSESESESTAIDPQVETSLDDTGHRAPHQPAG